MTGFEKLEIYQKSYDLAIRIHELSLTLPKYELYEQGSQIRRSSKSIKDTIAEGYGRRRYRNDFIRYLVFAQASCDEVQSQLKMINQLYFKENPLYSMLDEYDHLGRQN